MIVHIVLLQARANLTEDEHHELGEAVQGLAGVPGVRDMTWGPDISGRARGYTHGAVLHMESREALQAYQEHPEHRRIVEMFNRLSPERLILDYDIPD